MHTRLPFIGIQLIKSDIPFEEHDAEYLSLLCVSLKLKLEAMFSECKRKNFLLKNYSYSKVIVEILYSRSVIGLLKVITYSLTEALEFEHIEIIFHDSKSIRL